MGDDLNSGGVVVYDFDVFVVKVVVCVLGFRMYYFVGEGV